MATGVEPRALYKDTDHKRLLDVTPRPGVSDEKYRTEWRRDFGRLIHSPAFRRLQGKTQVFAGPESDFFRNRLTHSLEVAQIAKSIAIRLNAENEFFQKDPIDTTLVEIAALAHDLGHPPFGHNGEAALDKCMKKYDGFEGNAQTLRIISKLEKKQKLEKTTNFGVSSEGEDSRIGLNLTFRTIASIIKYDHPIRDTRNSNEPLEKGYYLCEKHVVQKVKGAVLGGRTINKPFKTIECSIMDLADDIAYSTYDMEDILKAGFVNPVQIVSSPEEMLEAVARKCRPKLGKDFSKEDVLTVLLSIFDDVFRAEGRGQPTVRGREDLIEYVGERWRICEKFVNNGYMRCEFTSQLVGEFIRGVSAELDNEIPALSTVHMEEDKLGKVEVLKHFTYQNMIMSPRMKVAEYRGREIVTEIFKALSSPAGHMLLPDDFREIHGYLKGIEDKKRAICDFIAGMTDRYALEFYGRLTSENAQSVFKPL